MIARAPQAHRKLVLSSRLGLVSVPEIGWDLNLNPASVPELFLPGFENGFEREQARELLRTLGRGLGLTLLSPVPAAFPEDGPAPEATELDPAVRLTLEGLDVVWMDGQEVVAVFVLEPRAVGWEGLRRLADLVALHPKLKAPLYAVTLPEMVEGIRAELHRPAFRLLKRPLSDTLRLLDWDRLRAEVVQLGDRVRYLKPEFLEGISDRLSPPASE